VSLVDAPSNNSYPISGYTYMIIRMAAMQDCVSATELLRFIRYFFTDSAAAGDAGEMSMMALSDSVVQRVNVTVLSRFQCGGKLVSDLLAAQLAKEAIVNRSWQTTVAIAVPLGIFGCVLISLFFFYQKIR
jgi:sensor c-di-GMP phosphodiesterase-like protein